MEHYAGAGDEVADRARQQERHYQLLSALQSLVKELPSSFQQRLSYTTLSDLALALLDGTVFEIVQGLLEIQHLTEKSLYNQRLRLQNEHRVLRQALRQKHQEAQQTCRPHNLPVLQAAHQRELEWSIEFERNSRRWTARLSWSWTGRWLTNRAHSRRQEWLVST
ncbi:protein DGCR6 isoform X2 [Nannospalax galili]|uniref:protein DGCR6 isoform X2 n=1 Tax=Nannospalax galili TaxID=1026970 RepID=UPI00081A145B|nr:protein DGCR6 isoform X2 [Nannospalax galili]